MYVCMYGEIASVLPASSLLSASETVRLGRKAWGLRRSTRLYLLDFGVSYQTDVELEGRHDVKLVKMGVMVPRVSYE